MTYSTTLLTTIAVARNYRRNTNRRESACHMTTAERDQIGRLTALFEAMDRRVGEYHEEVKGLCESIAKETQALRDKVHAIETNFKLCQAASKLRQDAAKPWSALGRQLLLALGIIVITAVCTVWFQSLFVRR